MIPFERKKHIQAIQLLDAKEQQGASKASLKNDYIDANSIDVDLDAPLYRIMNLDRLRDLLVNKRLGMVHPQRWEDPYEVFLMRSYGVTKRGQGVGFKPITNSLYGLCFSLKPECDGLWRSFTATSCSNCSFCGWFHKHGKQQITVKIKTTGRKLMEAFYDITNQFHALNYWIGKVDYCDSTKISQIIANGAQYIIDNTGVNLIHTLLVKRKPFEYEQEVRLLYLMNNSTPSSRLKTPDIFFFNVEPNTLIDEIEFSPWVDESEVKTLTSKISNYYDGNMTRSRLYDEPGIHIII